MIIQTDIDALPDALRGGYVNMNTIQKIKSRIGDVVLFIVSMAIGIPLFILMLLGYIIEELHDNLIDWLDRYSKGEFEN